MKGKPRLLIVCFGLTYVFTSNWNLSVFAVNLSPYPTNSCCKGILLLSFLSDVDMQHYNNLLDRVPDDICSVPLILHCVVEQVRV